MFRDTLNQTKPFFIFIRRIWPRQDPWKHLWTWVKQGNMYLKIWVYLNVCLFLTSIVLKFGFYCIGTQHVTCIDISDPRQRVLDSCWVHWDLQWESLWFVRWRGEPKAGGGRCKCTLPLFYYIVNLYQNLEPYNMKDLTYHQFFYPAVWWIL